MARLSPEESLGTLDDRQRDTSSEIWRQFHPAYAVSDRGRVKRTLGGMGAKAGRVLKPAKNRGGYLYAVLHYNNERRTRTIHSLVAAAFLGPCPAGQEVNHKDGDKTNNRRKNLEYLDRPGNIKHAQEMGLRAVGERHGRAKLTRASVVKIKQQLADGGSPAVIARRFGVQRAAVSKILHGYTWTHVS